MKRIGMLTSGGDCQSLNATMRGVAKALYNEYGNDLELIGFEDGYKGLMYANLQIFEPLRLLGHPDQGRHHAGNLQTALQADACAGRERAGQGGPDEAHLL